MNKIRFISLAASLVFAMSFTLSCSLDELGGDSSSSSGGGNSGLSLDGVWKEDRGSYIVVTVSGSTGTIIGITPENLLYTDGVNKGYWAVGSIHWRNLTKTGDLTWSGEWSLVQANSSDRNVAAGVNWISDTWTLSADGQTLRRKNNNSIWTRQSGNGGGGNPSSSSGGGGDNCTADFECIPIGSQVWAKKNLNYDVGVSKCYGNDPANCTKYGRLYDWNTAMTACPNGWHLPSNADWDKLFSYADGTSGTSSPYDSPTAGRYLKSTSEWNSDGNGTDQYGFSALPGGYGLPGGSFSGVGNYGDFWTSESTSNNAYRRSMGYDRENTYSANVSKSHLYSVRCVQD
jgi:uncharacterized protein (TIGR02145 family)